MLTDTIQPMNSCIRKKLVKDHTNILAYTIISETVNIVKLIVTPNRDWLGVVIGISVYRKHLQ